MTESYRVVVTRDGGNWLADLPDLEGAHTWARTLTGLDRSVREVIVLAADLPDEAMPGMLLDWVWRTGDPVLDEDATAVRRLRSQAAEVAATATETTHRAARDLTGRGLSRRDTAIALGISPQRVSQLTDS